MNDLQHSEAPVPRVEYLRAVLSKIQSGRVRIPAFQRPFVWSDEQVLSLLDSVDRGYPVGSLLFWEVNKKQMNTGYTPELPFPDTEESFPTSYVLDGLQRLASLYGVLFNQASNPHFQIDYDLRSRSFVPRETKKEAHLLPLDVLFDPRKLLQHQSTILKANDGEELLSRSINLQARFQDYLVPIVSIQNSKVSEVVEIFERINSAGTRLNAVDFLRALTWSDEFDLNAQLEMLAEAAEEQFFTIENQSLAKCFTTVMGRTSADNEMLELRDEDAVRLLKGMQDTKSALLRTIEFVREEFQVESSELIPYEGVLIVLVWVHSNFLDSPLPDGLRANLVRWYWSTGFNESLRGKPEHYVTRTIDGLRDDGLTGDSLPKRLTRTAQDLAERRFTKGKALSSTFSCLFAANHAMSLRRDELLPTADYLGSENQLRELIPLNTLKKTHPRLTSARLFANLVLIPLREKSLLKELGDAKFNILQDTSAPALESQFLDKAILDLLEQGRAKDFLLARAKMMTAAMERLCDSGVLYKNPLSRTSD